MENLDKHFHMSKDYEKNSSSQKTIGQKMIESAVDFSKSNFDEPKELKVLDVACGPGNLTIDLKKDFEKNFSETKIDTFGLDYSKENVDRLIQDSNGEITGVVGSFYDLNLGKETMDVVTSNEGLHWQPPHEMSEIIYSQLPEEEKKRYEVWALSNFKNAIGNIYNTLKQEGVAVLQFGHEGQLQKLWDLIRDVLSEEKFKNYKDKVNFPLFYPKLEDIQKILTEVGFKTENIELNSFNQDLTEKTPEEISGFLQAFSRPGFSKFFKEEDLNDFYTQIENKLKNMNIDEFRKDQWGRTLIKIKK
ncbi:MAG: class I SAM-dependent methyltransferase [Candidatus Paceibacterota bacterium]|jgi:SAM-dependent methyltransferase